LRGSWLEEANLDETIGPRGEQAAFVAHTQQRGRGLAMRVEELHVRKDST
jgi:hypothetical protein